MTKLSFYQLSDEVAEADTFDELKTLLMCVHKTADDVKMCPCLRRETSKCTKRYVDVLCK